MWFPLLNKLSSVRRNSLRGNRRISGKHRPKMNASLRFEALEGRTMMSVTSPFPPPALGSTISVNGHLWTADDKGLYHLDPAKTDLAAEWKGICEQMLAGNAAGLTPIQRLEGNAEAVFENTALKDLGSRKLVKDREDAQREFDAIAGAMQINANPAGLNIDPNAPLTEHTYLMLEKALQNDPNLYELGLQGHGLNDPPASRYRGYTNDFQNNVDGCTLFVGGGLNNNENALANFFDDSIMTHTPFPVVWQNGELTQLNQNADAENDLLCAVVAMDDFMYGRVLGSNDFSQTPSSAHDDYVSPFQSLVEQTRIDLAADPTGSTINGLLGAVSTTITVNGHVWTADASGLFHTNTDLAAEWKGYYRTMLGGHAGDLTPIERLEGNAEAVFEYTRLRTLSAAEQKRDREDVQRSLDAMAGAMQADQVQYGIDPTKALTTKTYLTLEKTLQSDATLLELAMQGHGLNNPPAARYQGYTNDLQNNVDGCTRYVGGGLNNGRNALADFFDDNVITHVAFPVVWKDGRLVQLNQDGDRENRLSQAVTALDVSMYYRVYISQDFSRRHHS
jgi:hypothetical protein